MKHADKRKIAVILGAVILLAVVPLIALKGLNSAVRTMPEARW